MSKGRPLCLMHLPCTWLSKGHIQRRLRGSSKTRSALCLQTYISHLGKDLQGLNVAMKNYLVFIQNQNKSVSLKPGHLTLEFPPGKISSRWHSVMLYKCHITGPKLLLSSPIIKDKGLLCSSALASRVTQARELTRSHSRLKLSGIIPLRLWKAHFSRLLCFGKGCFIHTD